MTEQELRAWMQAEASEPPDPGLRDRVLAVPVGSPAPAASSPSRSFRPLALAEAAVIALLALTIGFLLLTQRPDDQGAVVPGAVETDGGRASPSMTTEPKETEMKLKSPLVAATAAATLAVSAAAAQTPEVPAEFTGALDYLGGAGLRSDDGTQYFRYRTTDLDDDRLDGEWVLSVRPAYYTGYREPLWHGAFRVENADGAWEQSPHLHLEYLDGTASTSTTPFIGEGDYEGLVAFTEMHYMPAGHFEIRGVIVEGEVPEPPVVQPGS